MYVIAADSAAPKRVLEDGLHCSSVLQQAAQQPGAGNAAAHSVPGTDRALQLWCDGPPVELGDYTLEDLLARSAGTLSVGS